jgi:metal-responsive CopG/Arc/MetJ family transcriptional regulator
MYIQVNVNKELVTKIDKYAKSMGTSRSALCCTLIGQGVMAYDKAFETFDTVAKNISNNTQKELKK